MRNFFSFKSQNIPWPAQDLDRLAPLMPADWELIRLWRNAQLSILRQTAPLSCEEQRLYWQHQNQLLPEQTDQFCFAYKHQQQTIGYGGLVHIDWQEKSAELSSLLDHAYLKNPALFLEKSEIFLNLSIQLARSLGFGHLSAEAFDHRVHFIRLLYKLGFRSLGYLPHRKQWQGISYGSWKLRLDLFEPD
jgi:hypothetical protein